jgi:branched-chain amino acid aminotransferase
MKSFVYAQGRRVIGEIPILNFDSEKIGIFESLRTYRGKIFREEEHIRRFQESLRTSGFEALTSEVLHRELDSALQSFKKEAPAAIKKEDIFIRLTYWPEKASAGKDHKYIFVTITQRIHPAMIYDRGVRLKTSPVRRSLTNAISAQIKTTAYQNAVLATLERIGGDPQTIPYEWVFLDPQGFVTEVRIGNLFLIKDGQLLTPPTPGILDGVTRRFVIECALQIGIPVKELPITRHEVYNSDEAFLSNTSWEILPVAELDQRRIGIKIPGLLTCKLQHEFKKQVKKERP